jgi:hypothetical protein
MSSTGSRHDSGVPVETTKSLGGGAAHLGSRDYVHLIDDAEAVGKIGDRADRMREEVLDVGGTSETVECICATARVVSAVK